MVDAEARQATAADLEAAAALLRSRTSLQRGLAAAPVPTLYIWSQALLPKPADWPQHVHVVGPLLLRRQPLPPAMLPVPAQLQQWRLGSIGGGGAPCPLHASLPGCCCAALPRL